MRHLKENLKISATCAKSGDGNSANYSGGLKTTKSEANKLKDKLTNISQPKQGTVSQKKNNSNHRK